MIAGNHSTNSSYSKTLNTCPPERQEVNNLVGIAASFLQLSHKCQECQHCSKNLQNFDPLHRISLPLRTFIDFVDIK